ncbi:hypothetical protein DH2020_011600 [Rehmannia glutinosa]|uniref:DOG1 domain-containing protein n=1 Tax=Rehmannia glutinosa TaxID=99300 RepID=A0ABR0XE00_REHGL
MASFNHSHFNCCFQNWILQQRQDLEELLNALSTDSQNRYEELKEKGIRHFEEYSERRALMAPHDAASFMTPPWCSSFENAFLWVGGCRPSLSVRLVYAVGGSELRPKSMSFLGEEIADEPLVTIAKNAGRVGSGAGAGARHGCSFCLSGSHPSRRRQAEAQHAEGADGYSDSNASRGFPSAAKKLHISMHEWGKRRDRQFANPF